MEQELIRFAKMHGYINAFIMLCTGFAVAALQEREGIQSRSKIPGPIAIMLWTTVPITLVVGCVKESGYCLRPVKRIYIIFSIAGFFAVLLGILNFHDLPLVTAFVIFVVSLYGIYVVGFLEKLFNTLNLRRTGIIAITAIVCEDPSTAPPAVEQSNGSLVVPVIAPAASSPAAAAAGGAVPEAATAPPPQAKEFPSWT